MQPDQLPKLRSLFFHSRHLIHGHDVTWMTWRMESTATLLYVQHTLFRLNTLRLRQNDRDFTNGIVKCIFWKCLVIDYNFTKVCPQKSNWQYSSTGSDNGLAPTRRHWGYHLNQWWLIYWHIYASLGLSELKPHRDQIMQKKPPYRTTLPGYLVDQY